MIVLKAIGSFFVRIWRWIKETAWVQPLLIVGAIFAIIFSIPYITRWAQSFSGTGSGQFYKQYDISINGEEYQLGEAVTDGDKLAQGLAECNAIAYENPANPTAEPYQDFVQKYGEKFFVVFYKENDSTSDNIEAALKYLSDNWNKKDYAMTISDGKPFKAYAFNTSYVSDNDADFTLTLGGQSAFSRFLYVNSNLFEQAGPALFEAPYRTRASVAESNYDKFALNETDSASTNPLNNFPAPTICLVDFSQAAIEQGRAGLSEVLFTLKGNMDIDRAKLLRDMWNHTDSYSVDNLFTKQA
ncbi:MAG: hypothetical protein PUC66_00280 [Erysipelotrichaceae bacterium]|nr:hypothetical protein [Erysipelotrichaceae bacterium]